MSHNIIIVNNDLFKFHGYVPDLAVCSFYGKPDNKEMPVTSSPKIVISSYRYLELLLNAAERQFVKGIGSVAVVA